jgi:hypothetical protein
MLLQLLKLTISLSYIIHILKASLVVVSFWANLTIHNNIIYVRIILFLYRPLHIKQRENKIDQCEHICMYMLLYIPWKMIYIFIFSISFISLTYM